MRSLFSQPRTLLGWLLLAGLVAALVGISCRAEHRPAPPQRPVPPPATTVADLVTEIRLIGTINRLDLTGQQIDQLIPTVIRLVNLASAYEQRKQAVREQMRSLLVEKRGVLVEGGTPSGQLERNLAQLEAKLSSISEELASAQGGELAQIQSILTEAQMGILTGADEAHRQVEELLAWLREMPASDYEDEATAYAEALASPERGLDAQTLRKHFDMARDLAAEEYQSSQAQLIQRIAPLYGATPEAGQRALVGFFGSPGMVKILQDKAKAIAG